MRWRKVTLVGVGLLGGSLGLALRQRGLAGRVAGYVRRAESVAECEAAGAVDEATTVLAEAAAGADLIVLCTPLAQMAPLSRALSELVEAGALVTDVGSAKAPLAAELEPLFARRKAAFVGSHPMAGSEKTGVRWAQADLFEKAVCVVTPTPTCAEETVAAVENLWREVGGKTLRLSPELHDQLVARSSHLPHVLATALAAYVLDPEAPSAQARLCANGFRDTTRVASGSPEMWRDIVLMNRGPILEALRQLRGRWDDFERLLERADAQELEAHFHRAKALRDAWVAKGTTVTSTSPE